MEDFLTERPTFWKTVFSKRVLKSFLCKIAAGSFGGIVCIIILVLLIFAVGLFDTYVGYIVTWVTSANLESVCNTEGALTWFFCATIGLIDSVITTFMVVCFVFWVALICWLPVHFYQSYRQQYIREKYLETDGIYWTA